MLTFELLVWFDSDATESYTRFYRDFEPDERHNCITERWLLHKIEDLASDLRKPCLIAVNFKINGNTLIARAVNDSYGWRSTFNRSLGTFLEIDEVKS